VFNERSRRDGRSLCASTKRERSRRNAQSETQCQIEKASAFHSLSFRIEQANRDKVLQQAT
jgi:hypothetical protein